MDVTPDRRTAGAAAFAWLVHAITASSAIFALLSLGAIERGQWQLALLWLLAALVVDGLDGTLARAAKVKVHAARIDGETLDLIVDYLTYVFVPTIFIWRAGLVPEEWGLALAAVIQLSALYLFTRRDLKTDDNYFRGFPALWNVVALYLFVSDADPMVGAAAVLACAALTFAPVVFVHPFRVVEFQPWLRVFAAVWAISTLALLWPRWEASVQQALLWTSLAMAAILFALSLVRTFRGERKAAPAV